MNLHRKEDIWNEVKKGREGEEEVGKKRGKGGGYLHVKGEVKYRIYLTSEVKL